MKRALLPLLAALRLAAHPADEPVPTGFYRGVVDGKPVEARFSVGGMGILGEWTEKDMDAPGSLDGEFAAGEFRLLERRDQGEVTGVWRGAMTDAGEKMAGERRLPDQETGKPFELARYATVTEINAVDAGQVNAKLSVPHFTRIEEPGIPALNRMMLAELPLELVDFVARQATRPPPTGSPPEWEGAIEIQSFTDGEVSLLTRVHHFENAPEDGWTLTGTNLKKDGDKWRPVTVEEIAAAHGMSAEGLRATATEAFVAEMARLASPHDLELDFARLEFTHDSRGIMFFSPDHKRPGTGVPVSFRVDYPQ